MSAVLKSDPDSLPLLRSKRQRFVNEYLKDHNGRQAAIRAGYNPNSATEQASQLLMNLHVKTAIERGIAQQQTAAGLTRERVLNEIRRVAFSDFGSCFDEHGRLRPIKELDRETRAAIASVKVLKTNIVSGDGEREQVHEVKMWDKLKALDLAAKHLGLVDENVQHSGEVVIRWEGMPAVQANIAIGDMSRDDMSEMREISQPDVLPDTE